MKRASKSAKSLVPTPTVFVGMSPADKQQTLASIIRQAGTTTPTPVKWESVELGRLLASLRTNDESVGEVIDRVFSPDTSDLRAYFIFCISLALAELGGI